MIPRVLSNVANPKIALFFLAFLPQFVRQGHASIPLQLVGLGLLFALFAVTAARPRARIADVRIVLLQERSPHAG